MRSSVGFRRIDIHAHVNFPEFEEDRDAVVRRAVEGGAAMINVGTSLETSRSAVALANRYETGVYAIIGQHPVDTDEAFDSTAFRALATSMKVVGIGECGLDYFHLKDGSKQRQKDLFVAEIELANELGKPLMLHLRDAYADAIDILKSHAKVKGNSHFFAGSIEQAKKLFDLGFTISFTGVITFAKQYIELIEYAPLDMIQAETDCPFVAPIPYRGKRNEPAYVAEVTKKIAEVKKMPVEAVETALIDNARRVWNLNI